MDFVFNYFLNNIFKGASKLITDASASSIDIFQQNAVQDLMNFFQELGWIILAVGILFGVANFCINRIEGSYVPIDELFKGIFSGVIATAFIQPGAMFIFNLADTITSSISSITQVSNTVTIGKILTALLSVVTGYGLVLAILLGFLFIALWCFIYFQAFKRSAMYLMQIIIGYLYVFGLPSGNTEGIFDWCRQTAALAVTNVLQISSLIIALNLMLSGKFFPSLILLFAASEAEKIAGRFGMSVGGRKTIGSGLRTVGGAVNMISTVTRFAGRAA